jgi:hypothetical protein
MKIKCTDCGKLNSLENTFCHTCDKQLISTAKLIERLIDKQEALEARHQLELNTLKREISIVKNTLTREGHLTGAIEHPNPSISAQQVKAPNVEPMAHTSIPSDSPPETIQIDESPIQEPKARIPSEVELKIRAYFEPLHDGIALLNGVYDKYKAEGKLPFFFMTIAGIIAMLFGFGYLMQYSMQYLGDYAEIIKIALGFATAFGIGAIGIRLYLKNETYSEYGSALISLALSLNYLMIYFLSDLGNFPLFSSSILGFILITANTLIAIYLSLKFETKIVAVLFLLGGALAPFYLNSTDDGSLYYLYLWLLTIGANIVATRINWKPLLYLSFAVSFGLLEFAVFNYSPSSVVFTVYYHLFAYLFFYFTLFDKFSIKYSLTKYDIIILSGNLSFFLFNLYSIYSGELTTMGCLFLANAFVFGGLLYRIWKNIDKKLQLAILLIIGSFIGFAIPALVHQSLMGLFWSIEAIVLILLGFVYAIPIVRKEGYIVLTISVFKLVASSSLLIDNWGFSIWHAGFLNYIVLGVVILALWAVSRKFSLIFTNFEKSLYKTCKELIPMWLSSVFLIVTYGIFGVWALNFAVIPIFGLIYWSKRFETKYTDTAALAHLLLLIFSLLNSFAVTGSLHLSDQLLYAQISMVEFMACLWFLRKYYELLDFKDSPTARLSNMLHISFYVLIPLILIHLVRRNASELVEPAIWIGAALSYLMYKRLHYKALLHEVFVLSAFACVFSIQEINVIGLTTGILVLCTLLFAEKATSKDGMTTTLFKPLLVISPYVVFLFISLLNHEVVTHHLGISTALFASLVYTAIYFKDKIAVINISHDIGSKLAAIVGLIGIICLGFDTSVIGTLLSIFNLTVFGLLLRNNQGWYNLKLENQRWELALVMHQVQILIFYCMVILQLNYDLQGILLSVILVLHAIILLFVSMKNRINILNKTSLVLFGLALTKVVFNDIRDFDTAQKVVVLIVLGGLLLGASYAYLKLKKHLEMDQEDLEVKEEDNLINNSSQE